MNGLTVVSAQALWRELLSGAGIELKLKRRPGRDVQFDHQVQQALLASVPSLVAHPSVEALLKADARSGLAQVSVETLLVAVLTSQRDFGVMMKDILQTLALAEAQGQQPLSVSFRFKNVSNPIKSTLEAFRQSVERLERVLVSRYELASAVQLWELRNSLKSFVPGGGSTKCEGFPQVLPMPATQHAEFDHVVLRLAQLLNDLRSWCGSMASSRDGLMASRLPSLSEVDRARISATHDQVDAGIEFYLRSIVEGVRQGRLAPQDIVASVTPTLDALTTREQWVDRTRKELLDLLNLPLWRKRHELYSVWVGSVLLQTAARRTESLQFHPDANGVLSFAFGGSRLASYQWQGEQYDVWAELRSDLIGTSKKRKVGIQPDFRILRVDSAGDRNSNTRFVLECKHYLNASRGNFTVAADDYARSCPQADVFVVNHGPADHAALVAANEVLAVSRIRYIGEATAEMERLQPKLATQIENALFVETLDVAAQTLTKDTGPQLTSGRAGKVCLSWSAALGDLDVALNMPQASLNEQPSVSYANRGDLERSPYARLVQDVMTGPGMEVIDISYWYYRRYDIVVTNYSKVGELTAEHVCCTVTLGTNVHTFYPKPVQLEANRWQVGRIELINGKPTLFEFEPE